ncbi:cobalamin biosynthesis protein CobW [Sporanaerobium hydrogeniformans]|uniref:Cobalamin biosynthesis protein CobW n=1 Tax=Sporanaerobium hydrogeniformans TaxID=3072179 RepID=A0AC61DGK0_9FIRM|nr:GTP-binding protein [Sporanaerobium hydrogeniformans]PHV71980.1 cobalamin biosynthesis protein CobW [Sporanaerobium hydrogeniformans]
MTRIYIISGFLGAGKTTLIQKLLDEKVLGGKVALIENEFGEVGIDGGLLKQNGLEIKEMNSGCICCNLVGDFTVALKEILKTYKPEKVIIEPSGVGKLSDILKACNKVIKPGEVELGQTLVVVDGLKYRLHSRNFATFFKDQIIYADNIMLSRTQYMTPKEVDQAKGEMRKLNSKATLITTPWERLTGETIISVMSEKPISLEEELLGSLKQQDFKEGTSLKLDKKMGLFQKERYILHKEVEVRKEKKDNFFQTWGKETTRHYNKETLYHILGRLDEKEYGCILRAKGIVEGENGQWLQFDFVPGEGRVQPILPQCEGKLCVIGTELQQKALEKLFS